MFMTSVRLILIANVLIVRFLNAAHLVKKKARGKSKFKTVVFKLYQTVGFVAQNLEMKAPLSLCSTQSI